MMRALILGTAAACCAGEASAERVDEPLQATAAAVPPVATSAQHR